MLVFGGCLLAVVCLCLVFCDFGEFGVWLVVFCGVGGFCLFADRLLCLHCVVISCCLRCVWSVVGVIYCCVVCFLV